MRIMTNIPALQSYNSLTATNESLAKSIERLSTGLRINSAADDAAGLAISEKMRAQIRGLAQATRNAQDGISMIQTAEGALGETHSMLQRIRELAVQAANDTLTQEDRQFIQLEIDQLKEEITRISNTTQFNKKKLLDGSGGALWSSDNLSTKAIIKGGLRTVDQFGQKGAFEGNFKITVNANPGQAEIQKTDIFKIKHKNVIMDVQLDKNNGFENVQIDNLPAGSYAIYQASAANSAYSVQNNDYVAYKMLSKDAFPTSTAWNTIGTISAGDATAGSKVFLTVGAGGVFFNNAYVKSGSRLLVGEITNSGVAGATAEQALTNWQKLNSVKQSFNLATGYNVISRYDSGNVRYESFYAGWNSGAFVLDAAGFGNGLNLNASMLFEVMAVNAESRMVTFRVQVNAVDIYGKQYTFVDDSFTVTTAGVAEGQSKIGFNFNFASAFALASGVGNFKKGDKMVMNIAAAGLASATNALIVDSKVNQDWALSWGDGENTRFAYTFDMDAMQNRDLHLKNFYLNTENGTVMEGDIRLTMNNKVSNMTGAAWVTASIPGTARVSFEATYIGQVAKGEIMLKDLDKFWDANGKFMLTDPKEITLFQGDGTKTSLILYSTDTLEEVRKKLNDAIAFGLGQAKYVVEAANNFVSFVEDPIDYADEAVAGTFVIRSLIPGAAGKLIFSGDEDVIKALSLNVIQESKENEFRVSIYDAHTGSMVLVDQKVNGNLLSGMIHPNVDVEFDPMADIKVTWNETNRKFQLLSDPSEYSTILHLADNTTVFQVGANEGEDIGIDIGDMSARALGITKIMVTDRESAARAITIVDQAIGKVSAQRAKLGAYQNRLEYTVSNLTTAETNTTAAESRIRDVDMAKEMMAYTKLNILSQAGTSMLAQANQLPNNILQLLRG